MKVPKPKLLVAIATLALITTVVLLFVPKRVQTGEPRRATTVTPTADVVSDSTDERIPLTAEAYLQKAYRLTLEQNFEEAYGSFGLARLLSCLDCEKKYELDALKGLADCTFYLGVIDSCIYYYLKAVPIAQELNNPLEEYNIYSQLRQAYTLNADMQNVMLMEWKLDSIESDCNNKRVLILRQIRLSQKAIRQQDAKLAEHYLIKAESMLDSLPPLERQQDQFAVWENLRNLYLGRYNFEKARKYSRLLINAGRKDFIKHQHAYIPLYSVESFICAHQHDRKGAFAALDSMKYGLTLAEGSSPRNVMRYYNAKGIVHSQFAEWKEACEAFRQALLNVQGSYVKDGADYYQIYKSLGQALYYTKDYEASEAFFHEYARFCKFLYGEKSWVYADAIVTLAEFERLQGNAKEGKRYYVKATDINMELVMEQLRFVSIQERDAFWYSFAPKMWYMAAYAVKTDDRQSAFTEKCYDALLFSKSLLLETDRSVAEAINKKCTSKEQRLYREMQGLQSQLKMLGNNYDKNKDRIENLHQQISNLNQKLTPIISRLGFTSFLGISYKDIKQTLGEDEVLLDFTDFDSEENTHQYAVFVVNRQQTHPKLIKAFTEEEIKRTLKGEAVCSLYTKPFSSDALKYIWNPLVNEIKGKKTVYYVPSGMMHQIALESIPLDDGSLLEEHYRFVRLSSAREVVHAKQHKSVNRNATATLYGDLQYDMDSTQMTNQSSHYKIASLLALSRGDFLRRSAPFRSLPNTREEIDRIGEILKKKNKKVIPLTGVKGTEESFLSLSGKAPGILHIATHGFYYTPEKAMEKAYLSGYSDAMQLSGLIMSGGNLAWTGKKVPEGVLDGVLTANNIACMNLKGVDLLVLSACQTGLGVATPEGLFGLQRAFKKAGVQTIIMSLWNVDDEAAKDFMIKFYEELADGNNGWDKRKAFEKAKAFVRSKTYVRKGKTYKGNPYFWACFVMLD